MPSLEDLQYQGQLVDQGVQQQQNDIHKQAAQEASQKYLSGDIKGALATLTAVNPDLAQRVFAQTATTFNPELQGQIKGAEVQAELPAKLALGQQAIDAGKYDKAQNTSKEARLQNQYNESLQFKYQQSAESSPIYKSGITVLNEMPQLKGLLDDAYKNGGQSLAMLGPRIAKGLAGEVGVLTESDVTRYVRNPELAQWIIGGATKTFEGKLDAQDYTNLLRLGDIMQGNAQKKVDMAYDQAATKLSRNMGMPIESARLLVNPNLDSGTKSIVADSHKDLLEKVTVISPDGKKGQIPKGQLDAAKAQGYKLSE